MAMYIVKKSTRKIKVPQDIQDAIKTLLPDFDQFKEQLREDYAGDISLIFKDIDARILLYSKIFTSENLAFYQVKELAKLAQRKIKASRNYNDLLDRYECEHKEQAEILNEFINTHFIVLQTITNRNYTQLHASKTSVVR